MMRYFSYDFDDGMQMHATEEEAREAAAATLAWHREQAASDGEWPEEVETICWGEIRQTVVEEVVHDCDCDEGMCEYGMTRGDSCSEYVLANLDGQEVDDGE